MKISNIRVYDLEESIISSGFPMLKRKYTSEEFESEVENLKFWMQTGVMEHLYKRQNVKEVNRRTPNKIDLFDDRAELITTDNDGNETGRFIIDHESVPKAIKYKWSLNKEYCRCNEPNISLHRFLALDEDEVDNGEIFVDHIDKNTFNNKLSNLRITNNTNNVRNSSISKNNTSGIIGVNFRKDRNKWRAFIMVDRKQIPLGCYEDINQAIKARLEAEMKCFGEFAPQIELFEKYGVEIPKVSSVGYKGVEYNLNKAWKHFKRTCTLGSARAGSGHDCVKKGILVSANIEADQSFWLQWERYHHQDTISSMSTMHCLTKFEDLDSMFSEYTDKRVINILKEYIKEYNNNPTTENFHKVIHNCPEGIELCRRVTLNYLQIKTMLIQRRNHKMDSWKKDFVDFAYSLPYFRELALSKL